MAWDALRRIVYPWIYRNRFRSVTVDDLPDLLQPHHFYVIGSGALWSAVFLCPCGCAEVIHLSLLPDDSPSWSLTFDRDGLPTLYPSVWRTQGCRSHFFLRRGSVVWCRSENILVRPRSLGEMPK